MASLIARRTPSIAKLLKPYHPSSSSAYACLFSQASRNPNRELDHNPTFSSSAPRGRGAAFDPIRRSLGFPRAALGPISLLDQKARFSSSAYGESEPEPDKYNEIQCIMKSLRSKSKVLVALTLADVVGLTWVTYLTPGSSIWDVAAADGLEGIAIMVFFNYELRHSLKSPNFTELDKYKTLLMAADFMAVFFVITFTYYVLTSAVRLDTLLAC